LPVPGENQFFGRLHQPVCAPDIVHISALMVALQAVLPTDAQIEFTEPATSGARPALLGKLLDEYQEQIPD
jgi:hypothetical protein